MSENIKRSRQKRGNPHRGTKHSNNPRRGGPAILLTCERGREVKCKREGLEIIQHYLLNQSSNSGAENSNKQLSLEQEIAMLQSGASTEQVLGGTQNEQKTQSTAAFKEYETGCGGTVFLMCTIPDSALIPPVRTEWREANDAKRAAVNDITEEDGGNAKKRVRLEQSNSVSTEKQSEATSNDTPRSSNEPQDTPQWDPVETVQRVLQDLDSSSKTVPSSRFVTRFIPIQATCFTSLEEIGLAAKALVDQYLKEVTPCTFAIKVKRRNCTLSRDDIISTVAGAVVGLNEKWKVNLKSPDYTILVEVCMTLCGMTVLKDCSAYRNFNLLEIRESKEQSKVAD